MPELYDIELDEVSLVDAGDNPEAHVVFFKRHVQKDGEELTEEEAASIAAAVAEALASDEGDEADPEDRGTLDKAAEFNDVVRADMARKVYNRIQDLIYAFESSMSQAVYGELPDGRSVEELMRTNADQFKAAVDAAIEEWINASPGEVAMRARDEDFEPGEIFQIAARAGQEFVKTVGGGPRDTSDEGDDDDVQKRGNQEEVPMPVELSEEVRKGLPQEAQDYLTELEDKVNKATDDGEDPLFKGMTPAQKQAVLDDRARLAKLERQNEEAPLIAKARDVYKVAKPDEFGAALLRIRKGEQTEDDINLIEGELATKANQVDYSVILNENGATGLDGGAGTAMEEANAAARKLMSEQPEMHKSLAGARAKVYEQNPDLADRVRQEQEGR